MQACNSVNTAACSGYRTAATAVTVLLPPGVPSSISAIPPSGSSKSYTVLWGAASGTVTRYELEYRRYTASWLAAYSGLQLPYGMTVTQNGEYTHRVRACNSSGCSSWRTGALVAVGTIMLAPPPEEGEALPPEPADADLEAQVEHQRQATRLAALMRKEALHRQAWPEQPGSVVGGSGTGFRYQVSYQYDNWGHLAEVREPDNGNRLVWAAEAMDAFGHVKEATLGNGVPVNEILDAATGRMTNIQAGLGSAIQNLSYACDQAGNLEHRQDLRQGLTESFTYDNLHRLKTASVQGGPTMGIDYDAVGNITHKQVTGSADPAANYNLNYHYPANGARLTSISGDLAATMVYDANGSITGGLYTVTWTAFNMPASISKPGQGTSTFKYGPDRQRYRHDYTENGSIITRHIVGQLFEAVHKATVEEYHHHVMAYGEVVATHIRRSNGVHGTVWPLKDHLGSVDVMLDEAQQEVARTSFDAFGRRRSALTWNGLPEPGTIVGGAREFTNRGYTGHEMLDSVDLVHMNGRVYDPLIGRFLSRDPVVAHPGSTQGWNGYAYVTNNPLRFTDPSGFSPADRVLQTRCYGNCGASTSSYLSNGNFTSNTPGGVGGIGAVCTASWTGPGEGFVRDIFGEVAGEVAERALGLEGPLGHLVHEIMETIAERVWDWMASFPGGNPTPNASLNVIMPPAGGGSARAPGGESGLFVGGGAKGGSPTRTTGSLPGLGKYASIIAAGNIDVAANVADAEQFTFSEWVEKVEPGGDWDYKNGLRGYGLDRALLDEFGNFHFGVVAHAYGFNLETSMYGAGAFQVWRQGKGSRAGHAAATIVMMHSAFGYTLPDSLTRSITLGGFTWGDNVGDAINIMNGWDYYEATFK